jgi:hypothetical protein
MSMIPGQLLFDRKLKISICLLLGQFCIHISIRRKPDIAFAFADTAFYNNIHFCRVYPFCHKACGATEFYRERHKPENCLKALELVSAYTRAFAMSAGFPVLCHFNVSLFDERDKTLTCSKHRAETGISRKIFDQTIPFVWPDFRFIRDKHGAVCHE